MSNLVKYLDGIRYENVNYIISNKFKERS
jgi:hypothetical protein